MKHDTSCQLLYQYPFMLFSPVGVFFSRNICPYECVFSIVPKNNVVYGITVLPYFCLIFSVKCWQRANVYVSKLARERNRRAKTNQ